MLKPVLVRANFKVSVSHSVVLENIVSSNLPLLFPHVTVINRTDSTCSAVIEGTRRFTYIGMPDPDFDGLVEAAPFPIFSLGDGNSAVLPGITTLLPAGYGHEHEIAFTNSGPAAELWVSLIIQGLAESSIAADPLLVFNV